jgi:hypothetical protein
MFNPNRDVRGRRPIEMSGNWSRGAASGCSDSLMMAV